MMPALDNEDCKGVLLNCLKNLEKQVETMRSLVDQKRQTHIKGKQLLADLSKSVKFITDKFDKYEKKIIIIIKWKGIYLDWKIKFLEENVDQEGQYSKLLTHLECGRE